MEILNNLKAETVCLAFKQIIKNFGSKIYEVQCDAGSEFTNKIFRKQLKDNHILGRFKRPPNKASFAEFSILQVKKKIYRYMRSSLTHNWVSAMPKVVSSLNSTPTKKLGFLTPNSIINEASSSLVDAALKKHNLQIPKEPTYQEQIDNQQNYKLESEKNKKLLKKNDYVYVDFKSSGAFDKGYDILVSNKVSKIIPYHSC